MVRKFWYACFLASVLTVAGESCLAQYQITHLDTENGLPSNGIKGLQWDQETGFLWIATEAGVARYDGTMARKFDNKTNPAFGSGRVVFAMKNNKNEIVIGGEEGNLLVVKKNLLETYFIGNELTKQNYNHYCALSGSDTLFRKCYNNPWKSGRFSFGINNVVPINDTMLIVTGIGQLFKYSISTDHPKQFLSDINNVKLAFKIDSEIFFVDSVNRFSKYDIARDRKDKVLIKDINGENFNISPINSRIFWEYGMEFPIIIQQGKAWEINYQNNELSAHLIAENIPDKGLIIWAKFHREENILAVGTQSKGIYIIRKHQLTPKHPVVSDINEVNSFYSQIELPNGNILTGNGRIIGDSSDKNKFNIGPFHDNVFTIDDSLLLYKWDDTLFEYNKIRYSQRPILYLKTSQNFAVVKSQNKYILAWKNGIGLIGKDKQIEYLWKFTQNNEFKFMVNAMVEEDQGRLLIACCEYVFRFNLSDHKLDTILKGNGICIRTIYKEGQYYFFGTYGGGFYIYKNGLIKKGPTDKNNYLNNTHCFLKDKKGFCWISTNNGLFKAKMSDIISAFETGKSQVYFHYMGKDDGMSTNEMNGGCTPCAIELKNGFFSFPTMDGLVMFDPDKLSVNLPRGEIFIDKLLIDGREVKFSPDDKIIIDNDIQNVDFLLVVNGWCGKENLLLEYQLDNKKWTLVNGDADQLKISFNDLPYGTHQLNIRKMSGFGQPNYNTLRIFLTVKTPFYHQWWFRGLIIIVAAGFIYLILRIRLLQYEKREEKLSQLVEEKTIDLNTKNAQLEKNDEIKTRLIAVINHDIITPLKFMHYAGKALVENKDTITRDEKMQTISEITQTAKDMELLSSQILNWIIYQNPSRQMQKEEFDLHQLVDVVFGVLQFSARQKTTLLANKVAPNFVVFQYLEPLRVMLYNLVMNSLNFTRDGQISVNARRSENEIIIDVADSGLGMSEEQVANLLSENKIITSPNIDNRKGTGLGYMIIKDLIKMMGGEILIQSAKMKGTIVTVKLPVS